ncbi:RagB/SusD family nutrient uptake outer membrane protein [Pedobacter caeni]|uniref:Starch-binding associating with outer membrane n=1 Tax=Pedobacter caeni TaxID=288992 RepID=A0A1M5P8E4_9SPHI|nr:RagB/SusD family nutrient uptake outer membrane protein [Pedobacter caeni]SHG97967.1 Starch-binding associating with outer membrane [Pedobacter caeni]
MIYFINRNTIFNKAVITVLLIAVISMNFSCKKALDVQSTRLSTEKTQWTTLEDGLSGLLGMYALMRTAMASNNTHWLMGELRLGDFQATSRSDLKAIIRGDLKASYPIMNEITNWRRFYSVINSTSLFIERSGEILAKDKRYTKVNNDVDIAQARALRAFAYFYMVRIWGDVPLITSSHDGQFEEHAKTDQKKVLAFAEAELLAAAKVLPIYYGLNDPQLPGDYYGRNRDSWNGVLLTKISAYSILSHLSAWQGRYVDTEVYTKFVMDNYQKDGSQSSPRYISMDDLTENGFYSPFAFKRGVQIVGFAFEYGNGEATANGHIEQLTLAAPLIRKPVPDMFVPKDTIRSAFKDLKDLRFGLDTVTKLYRTNYFLNYNTEMPIFKKINVRQNGDLGNDGTFAVFSSAVLFTRLEEITLLRAEALAVLGARNEAIDALNTASSRRGATGFSNTSNADVIDAIFAERRRELMGEGWRWYDLVRYNRIKRNNPAFNRLLDENGIYWPISRDVLNANKLIVQNSYWN